MLVSIYPLVHIFLFSIQGKSPVSRLPSCNHEPFPPSGCKEEIERRDIKQFSLDDCCHFLTSLGLQHLTDKFKENNMDGPLLIALTNPNLGPVMLDSMGLTKSEQQILIQAIQDF